MKKIFSRLGAGLISDDKQKRGEALWLQRSMKREAQLIGSAVGGLFTFHKDRLVQVVVRNTTTIHGTRFLTNAAMYLMWYDSGSEVSKIIAHWSLNKHLSFFSFEFGYPAQNTSDINSKLSIGELLTQPQHFLTAKK